MKNVQMRINPELYAKFKLVDGESNNERMSKLLDDSNEKYALIDESVDKTIMIKYWKRTSQSKGKTIKTLASALVVSIAVSVACVGYVCVVNGWFL
ncbi:TMhelix containing protein [Vibrio phage 1.198.B._10N.286.54.F4]|nr:TMhelix containing protein [Vibrio phage 1.198.A._10N.286.54.F4]AUR94797.1 TMhelix containing protein [Vibrio phage 1.198.B._10N.286.54.F4]